MRLIPCFAAALAALSLAACSAGAPPPVVPSDDIRIVEPAVEVAKPATGAVAKADAALAKAEGAFARLSPLIDLLIAVLPQRQADRVRELRGVCEQALAAARVAVDLGRRAYELQRLSAAIDEVAGMVPAGLKRTT
jgi:hypothetical protein